MNKYALDIPATSALITRRRPALAAIVGFFQPLLQARDDLARDIAQNFPGPTLPQFTAEKAAAGAPVLAGQNLDFLLPAAEYAARKLLPLLLNLPPLAGYGDEIASIFSGNVEKSRNIFEALLLGDEKSMILQGEETGIPPEILGFAAEAILSPVLRALVASTIVNEEAHWDEEGAWNQGYCPVCGSYPAIAWLDKVKFDGQNAFLAGGGGKKHFHCSLCGANWKFPRGVCPGCGKQGAGVMEILQEQGAEGERLELCTSCHAYSPTLDLRKFVDIPNLDMMILGMVHLDMIAARKSLRPLKPAFWNKF